MKKKTFISSYLCLIIFSGIITAQDPDIKNKKRLKVYYNGSYQESKVTEYYRINDFYFDTYSKSYDFGGLSIAIEIDKGKFLTHEIELLPILINVNDNNRTELSDPTNNITPPIKESNKITQQKSALRYQVSHIFLKDKIINPYLGASGQVYDIFYKDQPYTSNHFPSSKLNVGCSISIIPGILVNLNNKVAFNFDSPIEICDFGFNFTNVHNPRVPISNQKQSEFIGDFLPKKLNLRIGLIYKL